MPITKSNIFGFQQQKITRHDEDKKKHSLKGQSKHQNQTQIWHKCWNYETKK